MRLEFFLPDDQGGTLEGRWVDAFDVRAGDTLYLRGHGETLVRQVSVLPTQIVVYTLTVKDLHSFAVGDAQVLVHNTSGSKPISGSSAPKKVRMTSWAEAGTTPDLNPERWVQLGGPTLLNFLKTGLWGGKFYFTKSFPWISCTKSNTPFSNYIFDFIETSRLVWPKELGPISDFIKGMLGQRRIKP